MSRIHEALKRAEQQRTVPLEVPPPILPEVQTRVAESPTIPPPALLDPLVHSEPLIHSEIDTKTRAAEFLRFDDIWTHCANPGWRLDPERTVFADPTAPPAVREQFRTLRSRLYQVRDKQPLRSILITSSLPGEGKTFVANNLAHALARQQNCRVLLIDADLRRPDLHPSFRAPNSPGLAEYLKGEATEMTVIQRGLPEYLCFIPGGTKSENPAELLANGRLKSLLQTIGPVFDWVILDSPPTLPVSDALMLAELCDGVLTVVRAAQTGFDSAQKSCQQLREKNLLGVALNCADDAAAYGSYYNEELKTGVAN
ncbi:MAG: capsular exopolysaccharide biosynthesis protein [Candidatus Acidoferrum typicum]|nr:capsular exopolysaccharide biosynthesis protein [Candidatus Acidoferrum typicum]